MTKLLALMLLLVMALHVIKPLGWPGLKRRRDVWKIAILAFAGMGLSIMMREMAG
jgi:hypothetical protein